MDRLPARLRSLWQGLRRGAALDHEMDEEFRLHMEFRKDDLVRAGLSPADAARQARIEFGSPRRYKDEGRASRGLRSIDQIRFSWLDVRLGVRMLLKHPAVTVVGVLAMAIGVGLGAAYLEILSDILRPAVPLHQGERIVGLQNWNVAEHDPESRSLADFVVWREELASIDHLGAFRSIDRNLGAVDGPGEPAGGAEISASAFQVAEVPALFGRTLLPGDEREASPPVVVLGYRLWQNRFGGDAGIVGQPIRLGNTTATVAGVMPEGFAFPVNHEFWVPLRTSAGAYKVGEGPSIQIFGRLAPGVSHREAQAELDAIGLRAAADSPATHAHLRPRVMRYTHLFMGGEDTGSAYLAQLIFVVLLLVLSSNVATMVFARTATRQHEIAMRFALGASRGRILTQFFVEALVLALAATLVGLIVAARGTEHVTQLVWQVTQGRVPFWLDEGPNLNATTILYGLVLAVLGALVAGVVPALKATSSGVQAGLRHSPGTGDESLRFGGLWSAMIVLQVAFAVLVIPPAIIAVSSLAEPGHAEPGFPAHEYLSARITMDMEQASEAQAAVADRFAEFQAAYEALGRRLLEEPEVSAVTFASRLPNMDHPQPGIDVDSDGNAPGTSGDVMASAVSVNYFDTLGVELAAGRGFTSGDLQPGARAVIVNEDFVEEVLGGRNAIGRRIRYQTRYGEQAVTGQPRGLPRDRMLERGPWYEIVGVVKHVGMDTTRDAFASGRGPGVFHPLTRDAMGAAGAYSVRMAFHVRGDVDSFAPQLRTIAHGVHPALRLNDVLPLDGPLDSNTQSERRVGRFFASVTALVALIALLISLAGIYSVMSFTVSRQTREIGIRIALGADRRQIVAGVFSRAMIQVGAGIIVGAAVWFYAIVFRLGGGDRIGLLAATAMILMLLGVMACGVPVRRALRIEPTEALRNVG